MNFVLTRKFTSDARLRRASALMLGLVLVQISLGVANVLLRVPPTSVWPTSPQPPDC